MRVEIINREEANQVHRAKQEESTSKIFYFITDVWNKPGTGCNQYWQ